MKTSRAPRPSRSRHVLSWVFTRDGLSLICDVALNAHAYNVSAIPLWDPQAAAVEAFASPVAAFSRHAELSRLLRASGWVLTQHSRRHVTAA